MTAAATICVSLVAACASPRALETGVRREGLTWKADVAPALAKSCGSCHGGDDPAGGLRTDDYFEVIARAKAGDAKSRLLTIQSDTTHAALTTTFATLRTWVVDDALGYEASSVHGPGLMNPGDTNFHGAVIARIGWKLDSCATCHAGDLGTTCASCHQGGLESCTGCHGQPPATGAHLAHVVAAKIDCGSCHTKPATVNSPGHLQAGPAAVRLAAGAFDASTKTCSGATCHGTATPTWTGGPSQATCGSCHGLPPADHVATGDACVRCHAAVVDAQRNIIDAAKHANGTVDFGPGQGCTSCHGQPPATGAHIAHTQAVHALSAPVACTECHKVPATRDEPGHLLATPQVTMTGARATGGGEVQPVWNAASATCANGCHRDATPGWNDGAPAAACGTCHGIPPASHDQTLKLSDCVRCHSTSVEAGGAIKVGGNHINGVVDVEN